MKKTIQLCLISVALSFFLTIPALFAAVEMIVNIGDEGVQGKINEAESRQLQDSKDQQDETKKNLTKKTPPKKPGKPESRSLPGIKLPTTKKPGLQLPEPRKSPLGQRPKPQLSPLLTRPGVGAVGQKGATAVSGIVVEKMRGAQQADLLVRGKGLNKITSALLFLNNRPVANVSLKRGLATAKTLKISMSARKGTLKNNGAARPGNYELRLRAGLTEFKLLTPIGPSVAMMKPSRGDLAGKGRQGKATIMSGLRSSPLIAAVPGEAEAENEPAPAGPPAPDLVVTSIRQDPPNPLDGQPWQLVVDIRNQGNAPANIPPGTKYMEENIRAFMSNDPSWGWNGITTSTGITLAPGQTHTGSKYVGNYQSGTHPVTVRVDPEDVVAEANEANNELTVNYTVIPSQGDTDLVITNLALDTANPSMQGFALLVTVENRGGAMVNMPSGDMISSVNSDNIQLSGVMNIDPGGSRTYTCNAIRLTPGPFNWTIMVDPDNRLTETNESNNTMSISGTIAGDPAGSPDLVVTSIRQNPPNPLDGQPWQLEVDIRNQGNAPANIPPGTKYMEENIRAFMSNDPSWGWNGITTTAGITLAPGQTHTGSKYVGNYQSGTHPVTVRVDPEDVVAEANEANNELTVNYTVIPSQGDTDLVITNIVLDTANPSMQGFALLVTVENRGAGLASMPFGDMIRSVNSDNIQFSGVMTINPGESRTYTCNAIRLSPGPFNWTIMVDPDNRLTETNEGNNTLSISGTIAQN